MKAPAEMLVKCAGLPPPPLPQIWSLRATFPTAANNRIHRITVPAARLVKCYQGGRSKRAR